MGQLKTQAKRQDDMRQQLDHDRSDIDHILIKQDEIIGGQTAQLKQMADFKEEIRQIVLDTIKEEVPKAVKKAVARELTTISLQNPRKAFERTVGLWESIIKLLNKIKTKIWNSQN